MPLASLSFVARFSQSEARDRLGTVDQRPQPNAQDLALEGENQDKEQTTTADT
jgi:hypothetical protein